MIVDADEVGESLWIGYSSAILVRGRGLLDSEAEEMGRQRIFLPKADARHMINEYERSGADKHGGGTQPL